MPCVPYDRASDGLYFYAVPDEITPDRRIRLGLRAVGWIEGEVQEVGDPNRVQPRFILGFFEIATPTVLILPPPPPVQTIRQVLRVAHSRARGISAPVVQSSADQKLPVSPRG